MSFRGLATIRLFAPAEQQSVAICATTPCHNKNKTAAEANKKQPSTVHLLPRRKDSVFQL
nr:uncharacterized protein CTRU02_06870 [Colletotrichum truncatum]KAF6792253.1 hypothetical protein CTRU02_06870 [Colletotrichum truncatum]